MLAWSTRSTALAAELRHSKTGGDERKRLKCKNVALIFEKASTRTRCACEVAVHDQGGQVTCLDSAGSQMGHKESPKDTARVLGSMFDGIEYRGFHQTVVREIAKFSHVPVWNGLTGEAHPSQVLADLLTMEEFGERPLHELSLCFLGDARFNMGCSLLVGGTQRGMDVGICCPAALAPPPALVTRMRDLGCSTGARITIEVDPVKAVQGADFPYADVDAVYLDWGLPTQRASGRRAVATVSCVSSLGVQPCISKGKRASRGRRIR